MTKKPGYYIDIEQGADKIVSVTQRHERETGGSQSNTMRLTLREAGFLHLALGRFLAYKKRRSIFIGKERA